MGLPRKINFKNWRVGYFLLKSFFAAIFIEIVFGGL